MSDKKLTKKHRRAIGKTMRGKKLKPEHKAAIGAGVRKSEANKKVLGIRWDAEVDAMIRARAASDNRPLVAVLEDAARAFNVPSA